MESRYADHGFIAGHCIIFAGKMECLLPIMPFIRRDRVDSVLEKSRWSTPGAAGADTGNRSPRYLALIAARRWLKSGRATPGHINTGGKKGNSKFRTPDKTLWVSCNFYVTPEIPGSGQ